MLEHMEDQQLENFFADARKTALTAVEKSDVRARLAAYMALTPRRAVTATIVAARGRWFDAFALHKSAAVVALVVAVSLSATGVSYAAESALPGDVLYAVKVGVNEEVVAAFARNEERKAEWEAERAARRLAEAERLAERGRLDESRRVELESRYAAHVNRAQEKIEKLRGMQDDGPGHAAEVEVRLTGAIAAHERIIAAIASQHPERETHGLRGRSEVREEVRADGTDDDKASKNEGLTESLERSAIARRATAQRFIDAARDYLEEVRSSLGVEQALAAQGLIDKAAAEVAAGDSLGETGDHKAASAKFIAAQKMALEAKLLIRARGEFQIRVEFREHNDDEEDDESRDRSGGERRGRRSAR